MTAEVVAAVPFYAGLTLEEIGGRGVRWQERDAASALAAGELPDGPLEEPPPAPEGPTLASAPTLWAGGEVRHSASLGFLAPDAARRAQPRGRRGAARSRPATRWS